MIITRSPLRITLGGGGTDLPSYYRRYEGFAIAAAINRYTYVNVVRPFTPGIYLKYSQLERVKSVDEIQHPIIREVLRMCDPLSTQIEITSLADIPAGTGLGSSSSFTTAILKAIFLHNGRSVQADELAHLACDIELDRLKGPVGKQDQYISAYGGLRCLHFCSDDRVEVRSLAIGGDTLRDLEENLLLFFTGFTRSAADILRDQDNRTQLSDSEISGNLHYTKELGKRAQSALEGNDLSLFGELLNEQWQHKKRRSAQISNAQIDEWYELALANGAVGGKLVGAGGGGFLLFHARDSRRLRSVMGHAGLQEVRFNFEFEGTKVLFR
jgi:D-glycero-alpha-D-manno-heptose-7-phosphate kinase